MSAFRILVADDHPIFRYGVCSLLESHGGWEVCGQATDGRDAVKKCRELKPDLLILDICLPKLNGVDAARQILKENPALSILVVTNVSSEKVVRDCLEVGIRGWVFKSDELGDLATAVEALQRNKCIYSSRVSDMVMNAYIPQRRSIAAGSTGTNLSPREREVVQLLAEGKSSKEAAMLLGVSLKTAETHRSNLMRKLNIHSITELVLYAVRNNIIHVQLPDVDGLAQPVNGGVHIGPRGLN